jgi:hypothetical protein
MVMLRVCVAVCTGTPESVACTVKVVVPLAVGVPVICPPTDITSPAGRVVLFIKLQLIAGVPPLDDKPAVYATPWVPPGKLAVVITSVAGCTVSFVLLVIEPRAAAMVEPPPETPVAIPAALMVATEVFDEDQVTWPVMFWVVLSL